ncbi:MAG: glycosyl transferase family protein [Alphaproteobacteria bacterium]|nr:glycosyl transferase family protein [Alphaproteobacteria bacterium]MBL6954614.1 glycosyl transferase family protein [Alphaproteobacteria bacterium]
MREEHPFAAYVRILGRGKSFQRALTEAEAETAMTMILAGEVLPEQLGAFLMLLRMKEETGAEIAGFVRAARQGFDLPTALPQVDVDWSCYAGKKRQLPWFVLAALVLAENGVKIFMHGAEGHTPGRVYAREVMGFLGLPVAGSLSEAAAQIEQSGISYLSLEHLSPRLHQMIELRPVLGLRTPVHTLSRMLNPFAATHMPQGIFHPGYGKIHQDAALLLGQPRMAVFRGEGGEIERRPHKPVAVQTVHDGVSGTEDWPPLMADPRQSYEEELDLARLIDVWKGQEAHALATAAVTGTLAIILKLMRRADSIDGAQALAGEMWADRRRERL